MDKKKRSKAAAELGRRGGLKGGAARARALTPEQRREISKKANAVRWGVPKEQIISDDVGTRLPGHSWVLDPALANKYTHIEAMVNLDGSAVLRGLTHPDREHPNGWWEDIPGTARGRRDEEEKH